MAMYQGQAEHVFSAAKVKIAGLEYDMQLKDDLIGRGFQKIKELEEYKKELDLGFVTEADISGDLRIIVIRSDKNGGFQRVEFAFEPSQALEGFRDFLTRHVAQYEKTSRRIIKFLAPDLTVITSRDPEYLLEACKRHGLCYMGSEEDIDAFANQCRSTFTMDSNTGLPGRSMSGRKRLHDGLEDVLLSKRQLRFDGRPAQQEMPLLQHMPTTVSMEIQRPEMSLQPAPSILQIEEELYAPFEIQSGDEGYHLFEPDDELDI